MKTAKAANEFARELVDYQCEDPEEPYENVVGTVAGRIAGRDMEIEADARVEPLEVLRALRLFFELDWRRVIQRRASSVGGYKAAAHITLIERTLATADALLADAPARTEPTTLEVLRECRNLMAGCIFGPERTQRLRDRISALLTEPGAADESTGDRCT